MGPGARKLVPPLIQIFGTKKCADSRRAERWWKERSYLISFLDLKVRAPSPGELRSIAQAVGSSEALIDRQGARYRDRGLLTAAPTGPRIAQHLVEDPQLLRTPIVRCNKMATVGFADETWEVWIRDGRLE